MLPCSSSSIQMVPIHLSTKDEGVLSTIASNLNPLMSDAHLKCVFILLMSKSFSLRKIFVNELFIGTKEPTLG